MLAKQKLGAIAIIAFITLCLIIHASFSHYAIQRLVGKLEEPDNMSITHIVLFQFKAGLDADVIRDASSRMLGLKDNCLHAASEQPYILASSGGVDNSIEGAQNGMTHAFVVQFASAEDRDYYVQKDPVHQAFVKSLDGIVEKAQVVDFTDRKF